MSTSIFCVVNFAARLITTSSLKGWKTLLGRAATSLRFAMNTWTGGTVGCRWRQWELLSSNWEAKMQVFLEAPPHVSTILYLCQDELEFGYIDSPHQRFPVVLDSPRDGKLQDFPYKELLVRDTMNSSAQNDTPELEPTISQGLIQKRLKYTVLFSSDMAWWFKILVVSYATASILQVVSGQELSIKCCTKPVGN